MAEVKDMYLITRVVSKYPHGVRMVDSPTDEADAFNKMMTHYYRRKPWRRLTFLFKTEHWFMNALEMTMEANYIEKFTHPERGSVGVFITPKGNHLVAKVAYFFRVGLWDETFKHYDKAQTVLITVIVAIISAFGGTALGAIIGVV